MIEMLQQNEIIPVFVFDGIQLPQKLEENQRRGDQRATARQRGLDLMEAGNVREAAIVFQQAISISPEMQRDFIVALRSRHIEYIVAPYEADAQLGFLFQSGDVDGVVSEDSDLILFGVRKLISKFAKDGFGELTDMDLLNSSEAKNSRFTDALQSLTHEQFLTVCIMSGCDYVDGLPGIGLKTALKYARDYCTPARILRAYSRKHPLPPDYNAKFKRALLTFQHQRVYDPSTKTLCHLSGVERLEDDGEFLGANLSDDIVKDLIVGALNVKTMAAMPLDTPTPPPDSSVPAPFSKNLSLSSGLKAYSDHVDVHKKKQKDFHNDVIMLKGIFGDRRKHQNELSTDCQPLNPSNDKFNLLNFSYKASSSQTPSQSQEASGIFVKRAQENIPPTPTSNCHYQSKIPPSDCQQALVHNQTSASEVITKSTVSQMSMSNKRPAPAASRTWVKPIKKPVQHIQRRLTDFFVVKQA